ncbi:hypothetical protein HDU81_011352 [Chytriomyces hyalinus]|nr:hypothetical protein HDU81_011352 [Chytriomyces hyalinus]
MRVVDDTNIIQALNEDWAVDKTTSPGFEYPDARLVSCDGSAVKVLDREPVNLYERMVFPLLRDRRDLQVWNVPFCATLTLWPSFLYMFLSRKIHPLHVALHLFACWWQITAYHLAIHVSSHRRVFKSSLLDRWIPVVCAPVFGHTVYTYYLHHIKMHHVADNSPYDISSTLFYQRDSLIGFLHYFFRFYLLAFLDLPQYFLKHNQNTRAVQAFLGELGTFAVLGYFTYYYNTMAMVWCFWVPMTASRFGMMSGNWVQHSFLDPKDPLGGGLHNSITVIESRYNLQNYNDGYHASHHLNAQRHWSEHPREFLSKRQLYLDTDAIILKGTDYDEVFGFLMAGNYTAIANKMIDVAVPGSRKFMSVEDRVAWLQARTKKFTWMDLERIYGVEFLVGKFGEAMVKDGLKAEGWTGGK